MVGIKTTNKTTQRLLYPSRLQTLNTEGAVSLVGYIKTIFTTQQN